LVEEEDQFTHLITLDEVTEGQDILSKQADVLLNMSRYSFHLLFMDLIILTCFVDVFKLDEDYIENEDKYLTLRKEILDESGDESDEDGDEEADEEEEDEDAENEAQIIDRTETNLVWIAIVCIQSSSSVVSLSHYCFITCT